MLLHGSEEAEKRTLTTVGAALVLCVAVVAGLLTVFKPFGGRSPDEISVSIQTPYIGPGVAKGTELVLHGVKVGAVTAVANLPGGGVRLDADLQKTPIAGLTDAMDIDFRPINYFGVTGINLIAREGGSPLHDGIHLQIAPKGNFALQALLSRLGRLATGTLTTRLIQVVDKATRYTDALNPLIETMIISANALADTQTVSTAQLLRNTTGVSVAFPSFTDALIDASSAVTHGHNKLGRGVWNATVHEYSDIIEPFMSFVADNLFGAIGKLEYSHTEDLLPVVDSITALTDVVPPLIRPAGISEMLVELRSRIEKMYEGSPEQRAIQVRIVLDSLPGIAAPFAAVGAP